MAALAASSAGAQSVDTTTNPPWNGQSFVFSWGVGQTQTYGETITATATQSNLFNFTFELNAGGGRTPQFQAFVYQWDPVNSRLVGSALFSSAVMTAPAGSTFVPVKINTGALQLTPGLQYVLFFTTSSVTGQSGTSAYKYGELTNNTAYPGGQFVFQNNLTFAALSTAAWSFQALDLAMILGFTPNALVPQLPPGATVNPTNIATALDNFGAHGVPTAGFLTLYNLSGQQLSAALSQLAGENNTESQQGAFQIMNSFMALMLDPLADNRGGGFGAMPFAPERAAAFPPDVASAYASVLKAPPAQVSSGPRVDVWGSAYGGTNRTGGDAVVIGSSDLTSRAGGFAAGADYRITPDTLVGFALAGGATSWGLSNGLGGGRSDVFQGGLYASQKFAQAYVSGALAGAEYWASTSRTVTLAGTDLLSASFNAQSLGGRVEAGYHVDLVPFWLTPYGALQVQSFKTPNYGESATSGSAQFALTFNSHTATATRTELGSWINKNFALGDSGVLDLFGRAAWAHDRQSDPSLTATFLGLPTVGFVVNGATPSPDLALLTTGAEWRLRNGVSLMAKFDGEFGGNTQTYTGTARLRYLW